LTAGRRADYDAVVKQRESGARRPRCARCAAPIAWRDNPHRPFCSLACRLIDLGGWLDEQYRIPGPQIPDDRHPSLDEDAPRRG